MLKLRIVTNEINEDEKMLENVETGESILQGDYYHDKINERIEGFLEGLTFCKKEYTLEDEVVLVDTRFNEY